MWLSIALAIVLIGVIHWFLNGTYGYWKKRNVPFPKPSPFIGNIGASLVFKKQIAIIYQEMYNEFKHCSWIGFYKLRQPSVLIRDVDLIKDVMIKNFSNFHDNDIDIDEEVEPLFSKNPFVLKGQRWKYVRSRITSAITTGKLKNMFGFMTTVSKDMVDYIHKLVETKKNFEVDAKDLCARFTTDVVASCAFGLDGNSFTENNEFKKMGEKLLNPEGLDKVKFMMMFLFPSFSRVFRVSFVPQSIKEWFMGILKETIKYREENKIVRNDYLDLILSLKNKQGEYEFTDLDVMAQSMTFYADGMETSATALSFILFELSKHPDIQHKLQKEVDQVIKKHNGEVTYETVQDMPYLDMVILETLRMYPPALALFKRCTKNYTLPPPEGTGPGVEIDEGMPVIIPVYALHMDPKYFPEPDKFIPERHTEEEKAKREKCVFLPFGEGPRQCLGFRFALSQIKAGLVGIVSNFEIKLNKKTTPDVEIDPGAVIIGKIGGIYLDFEKRSK